MGEMAKECKATSHVTLKAYRINKRLNGLRPFLIIVKPTRISRGLLQNDHIYSIVKSPKLEYSYCSCKLRAFRN